MTLVIDASVALKWFIQEDGSEQAAILLAGRDRLIAPDLIIAEVCNAGWKSLRSGQMTPSQHDHMASRMALAFDALVPPGSLARAAAIICRALDHPMYDCFYVALAERDGGKLITADQRLVRRLKATAWEEQVIDLRTVAPGQ